MRFRSGKHADGRPTRVVAFIATTGTLAGLLLVGSAAHAATTPTYEPDPNAVGSVSFYNASGNQITSGSVNDSPLAAYYKASGAGVVPLDNLAYQSFVTPVDGQLPVEWQTQEIWTSTQMFPQPTAPGALGTTKNALVKGETTDGSLQLHIDNFPLRSTANPGVVQVRMYTNHAGSSGNVNYYATDILVTGTTWTQIYPVASVPTATTTTLTVAPASPQPAGTSVGLTATVVAATGPAPTNGTVRFFDGATQIGPDKPFTGSPVTISTSTLTPGTHSLTATYLPIGTAFATSTSPAVPYTITAAAVATTTTLTVAPASPITVGTTATLTATVSPAGAAGSVTFFDGATAIGSPVAVSAGSATTTVSTLSVATHQLKAVFTPTSSAAYAPSTSAAVPYVVNAQPATSTTTTLAVSPPSPVAFGTAVTLTGTVSPAAAVGSIAFFDGSSSLGSVAVVDGSASISTSTLSAGSHQLTAKFVPTVPTQFGTSTSAVTSYVVQAPPAQTTTTVLTVSPASPATAGTSVTLTATVTPAGAAGTVQFRDGAAALGAPVDVAAGVAQLSTTALGVSTHSLSAVFTPTDPAAYTASTADPVSYQVVPAPPGATATTLTVSPNPVVAGSPVTLTATVTPNVAAGSVQFRDGSTALGQPVPVAAGAAQLTTSDLAQGTHVLRAVFTSSSATYTDSTSADVTLVVNPPPTATTTVLTVTPAGPVDFGSTVTLQATVTPSAAVGSVRFLDGTTVLGTVALEAGTVSFPTAALAGGAHTLTAEFVPTDPTAFGSSTSSATSLQVTPPPAQATTTSLAVTPAGPVTAGTEITLTATVTPAAAVGSVTFTDATSPVGSAPVTAGKAVLKTTKLAVGTRSLTATFLPKDVAAFLGSTSGAVTLAVVPAPTIACGSAGSPVEPGDYLAPGQTLTCTGAGFVGGETVTAVVGPTPVTLGTAQADDAGAVAITVTLPAVLEAGSHTLTLRGSIGSAVLAFGVRAAPTGSTTPSSSPPAGSGGPSGDGGSPGPDGSGGSGGSGIWP